MRACSFCLSCSDFGGDFFFLGNMGLIKNQDICASLDLLSALSDYNSFGDRYSLFYQGWYCLFRCSQGQLPASVDSFRSIRFFMGISFVSKVVWNVFILGVFSACLRLSTFTSRLLFLVFFFFFCFFIFLEVALILLFLSKIGRIELDGRPPKFQLHSIWGSLILRDIFFFFEEAIDNYFSPVLCSTIHYLCWEFTKEETHLPWLRRRYTTSILELGVGFRDLANFRSSTLLIIV